jgi:xylulokinase
VVSLETQEGSAYGAALLAMPGSVVKTCKRVIREVESVEPRAAEAERYAVKHEVYKSLYPALKNFYRA